MAANQYFINPYKFGVPLLLDTYSGAAAAYSLRRLSTAYTGPVVRVVESSKFRERNFTADEVADGTLAAWVGAGNDGTVKTWYDQSGNGNDASQATLLNQPQIVASGSYLTYIRFTDASGGGGGGSLLQHLSINDWHSVDATWVGIFSVHQLLSGGTNYYQTVHSPNGGGVFQNYSNVNSSFVNAYRHATVRIGGFTVNDAVVRPDFNTAIQRTTYANRVNLISRTNGSPTHSNADRDENFAAQSGVTIGNGSGAVACLMAINEIVCYAIDQTSNLSGIESNQLSAWGIL